MFVMIYLSLLHLTNLYFNLESSFAKSILQANNKSCPFVSVLLTGLNSLNLDGLKHETILKD